MLVSKCEEYFFYYFLLKIPHEKGLKLAFETILLKERLRPPHFPPCPPGQTKVTNSIIRLCIQVVFFHNTDFT